MMSDATPTALPTYFISHGGGPWPWIKDQMPFDLSTLSATDPVHAPSTSTGTVCSATVTPSAVPLELSSSTSHACATVCSHVPGTEMSCPEK